MGWARRGPSHFGPTSGWWTLKIVSILESGLVRGGREGFHRGQLKYLAATGHQVVLFVRDDPPEQGWGPDVQVKKWPAGAYPKVDRRKPRTVARFVRLAMALRHERPDVVYVPARLLMAVAAFAALLSRSRLVIHMHDPVRSIDRLDRWAARRAQSIIGVSFQARDEWVTRGLRGSWIVVHNGVALDHFRPPTPPDRVNSRRILGIGSAPVVAFVGRDVPGKGVDVLVEAMSDPRLAATELVLAGGKANAAEQNLSRGRFRQLGWVDPLNVYWSADAVAVPSDRLDPFPLVPLEAMACGCPTVVTTVAAAAESLPGSFRGDLMVLPGCPKRLADALVAALAIGRDPAQRNQIRAHAEERFDVSKVYRTVAEVLAGPN